MLPIWGLCFMVLDISILCIWKDIYDVPILITKLFDFIILKQNEDSVCHSCWYCTNWKLFTSKNIHQFIGKMMRWRPLKIFYKCEASMCYIKIFCWFILVQKSANLSDLHVFIVWATNLSSLFLTWCYFTFQEQFFDGYPSVYALTKKRNLLLGTSEGDDGSEMNDYSRNPPWIKCCLKSYHIDDSDVWGSRNFRIFATTLKV